MFRWVWKCLTLAVWIVYAAVTVLLSTFLGRSIECVWAANGWAYMTTLLLTIYSFIDLAL
jgi:hypothetical protein